MKKTSHVGLYQSQYLSTQGVKLQSGTNVILQI